MRRAAIALAVATLAVGAAAPAVADETATARHGAFDIDVRRDLTYRDVDRDNLKLDAYVPAGGGRRPGVIVIFGGGWVIGNRKLSGPVAQVLADRGFVAFAIDYRLAPQHPYPAAVDDVRASVEWVRAHAFEFGVDPARLGAIGGSAGGHLAALLATLGDGPHDRGARVAAAVSLAGPMDLHPALYDPESHPYIRTFLDCLNRVCDEVSVVAASPISHVNPGDSPIFLANGEDDVLVPPDQAVRMSEALERAGVRHDLLLVPDAGHDPRIGPPVVEPSFQFLRRELGGVEPAGRADRSGRDNWGLRASIVAVVIAALVVGAALVVVGRRRQRVRQ